MSPRQISGFEQSQAFNQGLSLYRAEQYDAALKSFRKAVATDNLLDLKNSDPLLVSYYGVSLAKVQKKYDVAQKLCRQAQKRGADLPDVFFNLGEVYEAANKPENAISVYREGFRRHPDETRFLVALERNSPRGKLFFPFLGRQHFVNKYLGLMFRKVKMLIERLR